MRYPAHLYAKALAEALALPAAEDDKVVKRFLALLRRNGDDVHLRKILEETARLSRGKKGIRKFTVESARPLTAVQRKLVQSLIEKDDIVLERIDPDIVAGLRIIVNDEFRFDGSLKGKIDAIFGT